MRYTRLLISLAIYLLFLLQTPDITWQTLSDNVADTRQLRLHG